MATTRITYSEDEIKKLLAEKHETDTKLVTIEHHAADPESSWAYRPLHHGPRNPQVNERLSRLRLAGKTAEAVAKLKRHGGSLVCRDEAQARAIARVHGGTVKAWDNTQGSVRPQTTWVVEYGLE